MRASVVALTAFVAVHAVCARAGLGHVRHLAEFRRAVEAHGIVPHALAGPVALTVVLAELGIPLAGMLSLWPERALPGPVATAMAAAALYAGFTVYATALFGKAPTTDCGCGGRDEPISAWVPLRAGALAAASVYAAVALGGSAALRGVPGPDLALAGLSGLGFAALAWVFPGAMRIPGRVGRGPKFAWIGTDHAA